MSFDDNHDHDIDVDGDDDEGGEFEVNIDPREDELERLGIEQEDFEQALYAALDAQGETLEGTESGDVSTTLEAVSLTIRGETYRLGDLAYVTIDEPGEDDDDDDDDEEFSVN